MREILFRGKVLVTEDWIEGSLIIDEKGNCYIGEYIPNKNKQIVSTGRAVGKTLNRFIGMGFVMVDKTTISQYTGTIDKNGKKIFEGDIISIRFETDGVDGFLGYSWYESAEVVYSNEKHAWIVVFEEGGEELYLNEYDDMDDVYVIANIYDSPKLINN